MNDFSDPDEAASSKLPASQQPPRTRRRRPFVILALVLIALGAGGFAYWWHARNYVTTTDAQIDGAIHRIAPRISGQVAAVLVHENQHVAKGQVLVRLDSRSEQVALDRAEAQEAQAEAELGTRQADVGQAQASVDVAEANLYKAQTDAMRYDRVNPQAVTSANRDAATSALKAGLARVKQAKQQVQAAQAGVVAAQAAVKAAKVGVENAKLNLTYTKVRAPVTGFVARKTVRSGNVVAAGTAMMAVVSDHVWVTANYKETALGRIHPGQRVKVYVDAVPGVAFDARVSSIQHGTGSVFSLLPAENATGNYVKVVQRVPVRIDFDDSRVKNYLLAPGMSVEPYIHAHHK